MQQIALNLIAIGVFGMTLSVLLGPLLNISPAIPAVTTFGVLSLVTLDGFSFQGKGLTLL
ncbi:MAG: ATP-dependent Zn protease, partial [Moorea sp. SIO3E2]|nr:ATP-dependent Zn protease [Moorena sp. SIO3E2]